MLAVIKTGGKQYLVSPGQKIKVEKLIAEEGKEVIFDEVLLLEKDKKKSLACLSSAEQRWSEKF
jgi:large subunit ribosomal protein L21